MSDIDNPVNPVNPFQDAPQPQGGVPTRGPAGGTPLVSYMPDAGVRGVAATTVRYPLGSVVEFVAALECLEEGATVQFVTTSAYPLVQVYAPDGTIVAGYSTPVAVDAMDAYAGSKITCVALMDTVNVDLSLLPAGDYTAKFYAHAKGSDGRMRWMEFERTVRLLGTPFTPYQQVLSIRGPVGGVPTLRFTNDAALVEVKAPLGHDRVGAVMSFVGTLACANADATVQFDATSAPPKVMIYAPDYTIVAGYSTPVAVHRYDGFAANEVTCRADLASDNGDSTFLALGKYTAKFLSNYLSSDGVSGGPIVIESTRTLQAA